MLIILISNPRVRSFGGYLLPNQFAILFGLPQSQVIGREDKMDNAATWSAVLVLWRILNVAWIDFSMLLNLVLCLLVLDVFFGAARRSLQRRKIQKESTKLKCLFRRETFIGFCVWDGHDQEDAPDWASNNAKLIIRICEALHDDKLEICC
ncbi:hypothetical protein RIF29_20597 [Crotalaria pallida]|uniref:Uncharacterized protein n=1 Tax=Crotalaria pallida TaxID=3830 RepID=A0AAN9F4V8_CROPI